MTKPPRTLNRRETLLAVAGAFSAGVSLPAWARRLSLTRDAERPLSNAPSGDAVERHLREDLARLGERAYSDEGIPVFLACVNVAAANAHRAPVQPPLFSQSIAAQLRANGAAWLHINPEAPATDISKLIEVLAERDFGRLGKAGA